MLKLVENFCLENVIVRVTVGIFSRFLAQNKGNYQEFIFSTPKLPWGSLLYLKCCMRRIVQRCDVLRAISFPVLIINDLQRPVEVLQGYSIYIPLESLIEHC